MAEKTINTAVDFLAKYGLDCPNATIDKNPFEPGVQNALIKDTAEIVADYSKLPDDHKCRVIFYLQKNGDIATLSLITGYDASFAPGSLFTEAKSILNDLKTKLNLAKNRDSSVEGELAVKYTSVKLDSIFRSATFLFFNDAKDSEFKTIESLVSFKVFVHSEMVAIYEKYWPGKETKNKNGNPYFDSDLDGEKDNVDVDPKEPTYFTDADKDGVEDSIDADAHDANKWCRLEVGQSFESKLYTVTRTSADIFEIKVKLKVFIRGGNNNKEYADPAFLTMLSQRIHDHFLKMTMPGHFRCDLNVNFEIVSNELASDLVFDRSVTRSDSLHWGPDVLKSNNFGAMHEILHLLEVFPRQDYYNEPLTFQRDFTLAPGYDVLGVIHPMRNMITVDLSEIGLKNLLAEACRLSKGTVKAAKVDVDIKKLPNDPKTYARQSDWGVVYTDRDRLTEKVTSIVYKYRQKGLYEKAISVLKKYIDRIDKMEFCAELMNLSEGMRDSVPQRQAKLIDVLKKWSNANKLPADFVARCFSAIRRYDLALDVLESAIKKGDLESCLDEYLFIVRSMDDALKPRCYTFVNSQLSKFPSSFKVDFFVEVKAESQAVEILASALGNGEIKKEEAVQYALKLIDIDYEPSILEKLKGIVMHICEEYKALDREAIIKFAKFLKSYSEPKRALLLIAEATGGKNSIAQEELELCMSELVKSHAAIVEQTARELLSSSDKAYFWQCTLIKALKEEGKFKEAFDETVKLRKASLEKNPASLYDRTLYALAYFEFDKPKEGLEALGQVFQIYEFECRRGLGTKESEFLQMIVSISSLHGLSEKVIKAIEKEPKYAALQAAISAK